MMKKSFIFSALLAAVIGLIIAWIDSRPNWDDSGISAFLIFVAAALCGYLAGIKPWLIALLVSIWIPFYGLVFTHNYGSFLALIPGFIGAFSGWGLNKMVKK